MAITRITLGGKQISDFIWIKKGEITAAQRREYMQMNFVPSYDSNTELYAPFNQSLSAGNVDTEETDVEGWVLYRKSKGSNALQYINTLDPIETSTIDYLTKNEESYIYQLFLNRSNTFGKPLLSNEVTPRFWNWVLIITDETDDDQILKVAAIYAFQGNVSTGEISNNAVVNLLNNFTPFPKTQTGSSNYKSSTLGALIGKVDLDTNEYIEYPGLVDELFALTTDGKRKFLKNRKGDIWEVKLSAETTMQVADTSRKQPYTGTFKWHEVCKVKNISVVK